MSSQVRHARSAMAHTEIDRTACPRWQRGERKPVHHGTESAERAGCRCPDAANDRRRKQIQRRLGTAQSTLIPGIGVKRRLRALARVGWSTKAIARETGLEASQVGHLRSDDRLVHRTTHDLVTAVYRRLWATPGGSSRAAGNAARRGWEGPCDWENIDDPRAASEQEAEFATEGYTVDNVTDLCGKTNDLDADPDVNAADALFYRRIAWDSTTPIDREYAVWQLHEHWSVGEIAQAIGVNQRRVSRALRAARERWQNNNDQTAA